MEKHCCPNCGNHDLQALNHTNVQTHGSDFSATKGCLGFLLFGPLGILCGTCGQGKTTTTTNQTFWVCNKCGNKFRDVNEQRKEAETLKNMGFTFVAIFVVVFFIALFAGISNDFGFFSTMFMGISIVLVVVGLALAGSGASGVKKADEIEAQMSRFNTGGGGYFSKNTPSPAQSFLKKPEQPKQVGIGEWKCTNCGRINKNYVGTCGCGQHKPGKTVTLDSLPPDKQYEMPDVSVDNSNESLPEPIRFCPNCGAKNLGRKFCPDCGTKLSDFDPIMSDTHWRCLTCGKLNKNDVKVCRCGQEKPI